MPSMNMKTQTKTKIQTHAINEEKRLSINHNENPYQKKIIQVRVSDITIERINKFSFVCVWIDIIFFSLLHA